MKSNRMTWKAMAVVTSVALFASPLSALAAEASNQGGDSIEVVENETLTTVAQPDADAKKADITKNDYTTPDMDLFVGGSTEADQDVTPEEGDETEGTKQEPIVFKGAENEDRTIDQYELLKGGSEKTTLKGSWYAVTPECAQGGREAVVRYESRVDVKGDVNIVIGHDVTLEFAAGIHLPEGSKLTVWSVDGKYAHGVLRVGDSCESGCAGIGGNAGEDGGVFVLGSGDADVTGIFGDGAAIGGGDHGNGGEVHVYNGMLRANNEGNGACIGGGNCGSGGDVYVYEKGELMVLLHGLGNGAAIGGGYHGAGGDVKIYGGRVSAEGGNGSACIGGGEERAGGMCYVGEGSRLDLRAYNGGMAIGSGKGFDQGASLFLYDDACVSVDKKAVDADQREKALETTDADICVRPCEHKDTTYKTTEDEHIKVCKHCGKEYERAQHEFGDDDVCDVCGYEKQAEKPVAQIDSHTLNLEGKIGVNTYLLFDESVDIAHHGSEYLIEFYDPEGNLYSVSCPGVPAADGIEQAKPKVIDVDGKKCTAYVASITTVARQMGTKYTMKIRHIEKGYVDFANFDGTIIDGEKGFDYSVMDYLDAAIAKSTNKKMVALAKDMKNYGIYAKHYFDVRNGSKEALPTIDGFKVINANDLGVTFAAPKGIKHFTYDSASLNLIDETEFKLYFTTDDVSKLNIKVKRNGKVENLTPKQSGKNTYCVDVSGIAAKRLDDMYEFIVTNGEETLTFEHGPFGFGYAVLPDPATQKAGANENLQYLVMSMYHYNTSAKSYFNV